MQLARLRYSLILFLLVSALVLGDEDSEEDLFEESEYHSGENENSYGDDMIDDASQPSAPAATKPASIVPPPERSDDGDEDAFVWPTTEEEMKSEFLSDEHHCNGCKGVAFQINKALHALMPVDGPRRKLGEHEYIEAMECRTSIYDDYGLKKLPNQTRVLTGPGLEHEDYKGSKFGGARWPARMARFCGTLVGELGEEEVYRLWTDYSQANSYASFTEKLCSPHCGGPARHKVEETNDEDVEKPKKKKPKAKKKESSNDVLDGPPQVVQVDTKKQIEKMVNKKHIFVFLMFCAPSFNRCSDLQTQWERAARAAKKDKAFKDVRFALADTDKVGTLDYELDRGILPAFLLFRRGYAAPKGVKADDMLKLREAGDFLNFMGNELGIYMQDDPVSFPRGKLEL